VTDIREKKQTNHKIQITKKTNYKKNKLQKQEYRNWNDGIMA